MDEGVDEEDEGGGEDYASVMAEDIGETILWHSIHVVLYIYDRHEGKAIKNSGYKGEAESSEIRSQKKETKQFTMVALPKGPPPPRHLPFLLRSSKKANSGPPSRPPFPFQPC